MQQRLHGTRSALDEAQSSSVALLAEAKKLRTEYENFRTMVNTLKDKLQKHDAKYRKGAVEFAGMSDEAVDAKLAEVRADPTQAGRVAALIKYAGSAVELEDSEQTMQAAQAKVVCPRHYAGNIYAKH
jgi:hypothetical protein